MAVGVCPNGSFRVLDWQAAPSESAEAYERVFTRLRQRGLERVELIVSDGAEGVVSGAATLYPGAAHQLCLAALVRVRYLRDTPCVVAVWRSGKRVA